MQAIGSFAGTLYIAHEIISWLIRLMMAVKSHLIVTDAFNKVSKFSSLSLRVKSLMLGDSLAGCRERFFLQLLLIFQNLKMGEQAKKKKFECIHSLIPASMSPQQPWKCGLKNHLGKVIVASGSLFLILTDTSDFHQIS